MSRHNDVFKQSSPEVLNQLQVPQPGLQLLSLALIASLALTTLACAFLGINSRSASRPIIIRGTLPTLTPTARSVLTPPAISPLPVTAVAAAPVELTPSPQPPTVAAVAAETGPIPSPTLNQNSEPTNAPIENSASPSTEVATPTPFPTSLPAATATEEPTPTSVPTPTPTAIPTPTPSAWLFAGVRVSPAADGNGLLLYGDIINNTGSSQILKVITATFHDAQGQVISPSDITDYWPTEAIPPGAQVPFELKVAGVSGMANFDLSVEAVPGDQTPRQDFEFSDLNQTNVGEGYCLAGTLRDQGSELREYLVIVAILYDPQNNVVNFGDYYESDPEGESDEHTLDFELCVDPLGQNVARHELRAWGL